VRHYYDKEVSVSEHNQENIDVTVVVSGQPERLKVNVHQTLDQVVHEALQRSGNHGQASSDWELRTEDGRLLEQSLTVAASAIHEGATLFLSPRAGAGG
jgi:hypothetical protein